MTCHSLFGVSAMFFARSTRFMVVSPLLTSAARAGPRQRIPGAVRQSIGVELIGDFPAARIAVPGAAARSGVHRLARCVGAARAVLVALVLTAAAAEVDAAAGAALAAAGFAVRSIARSAV